MGRWVGIHGNKGWQFRLALLRADDCAPVCNIWDQFCSQDRKCWGKNQAIEDWLSKTLRVKYIRTSWNTTTIARKMKLKFSSSTPAKIGHCLGNELALLTWGSSGNRAYVPHEKGIKWTGKERKESRRAQIARLSLSPAILTFLLYLVTTRTKFLHVNPTKSCFAFKDLPGAKIFLSPRKQLLSLYRLVQPTSNLN